MKFKLFYIIVLLLFIENVSWCDTSFDIIINEVIQSGEKEEINDYNDFQIYYTKIEGLINEDRFMESIDLIDKYIYINKQYFEKKLLNDREIRVQKFVLYFTLLKGIIKVNEGEVVNGVELIYLSYSLFANLYYYTSLSDTSSVAILDYSYICKEMIESENLKKIIKRICDGKFSVPFINPRKIVNKKYSEIKDNVIGEIIFGLPESEIDELKDIISQFKYYTLLSPIKDALIITYNPKNKEAVRLMKKISKEMGEIINNEVDEKYHFLQFKILKNDKLEEKLLKKYIFDLK